MMGVLGPPAGRCALPRSGAGELGGCRPRNAAPTNGTGTNAGGCQRDRRAQPSPPTRNSPGQQGAEVVRRGGVRADGGGRDEGCGFGPVLAPVVRPVGAQAGGDGLPVDHCACGATTG